jgi:hypothetical protein
METRRKVKEGSLIAGGGGGWGVEPHTVTEEKAWASYLFSVLNRYGKKYVILKKKIRY